MTDTQKRTVVILDMHGEYRSLMRFCGPEEMIWLRADDDAGLNPFAVPTGADGRPVMSPQKWLAYPKEWLRQAWLGEISGNLLLRLGTKLYRDRGVFKGSGDYPCHTRVPV